VGLCQTWRRGVGPDIVIRQPPISTIVSGENAQLQQVILNLCNNAALAMRDGGRIEIAWNR
jgi:signal transduction histidine kinase